MRITFVCHKNIKITNLDLFCAKNLLGLLKLLSREVHQASTNINLYSPTVTREGLHALLARSARFCLIILNKRLP